MSKLNRKELLRNIINNNTEFRPIGNDSQWSKESDKEYYTMSSSKHYSINEKLVKIMEKYSKLNKLNKDLVDKKDDGIAIIYLMENDKSGEKYVGYTTNPLFTFIKLNIHKYNIDQDNVFDNFDNPDSINLTDFSFEIVEFIKYKKRANILERKKMYTKRFIKSKIEKSKVVEDGNQNGGGKKKTVDPLDKIYDKRMDIFFELLGAQVSKFKSFVGYVYMLENTSNHKKFIGGYHKKLTKKNLVSILLKNKSLEDLKADMKRYGRRSFEFTIIEKYDAKTTFDFLLKIDFFKIKHDSIKNGYNQGFSLEESEDLFSQRLLTRKKRIMSRNIFLKIQKYLFEKNFKDPTKYDDLYGFVYQIQHKKTKMRYFAYTHLNKLKNIIIGLYNQALQGNVKHSKILKVLEEETYESFTFKIIKKKKMDDHKVSLEDEMEKFIIQYDTINNGYNLDKKKLRRNIGRSRRKSKKV